MWIFHVHPQGFLDHFEITDFSVNLITSVTYFPGGGKKKKSIHNNAIIFFIQFLEIHRFQKLIHGPQFKNPSLGYGHGRDTCLKSFPGEEGAEKGERVRVS